MDKDQKLFTLACEQLLPVRMRATLLFLLWLICAAITTTCPGLAIESVTEPSSPNQPSLGRPALEREPSDPQSHRDYTPQPDSRLQGDNQTAPLPGNSAVISSPQILNKQNNMSAPYSATKWPENVFQIGKVDIDMLAPGQINFAPSSNSDLMQIGNKLNPLRLEASYDEPITLKRTLELVLENNLPIKISKEGVKAAHYRYIAALGRFLPDWENEYQDQAQRGALSINGALFISLNNPFVFTRTGLRQYVYKGGSIVFGAKRRKHLLNAAKYEDHATVSDALLEASRRYYSTQLEEVLLRIRIKSLKASDALLIQNDWLRNNGLLTKLEVLQAQAQVARDKQLLIHEQIARRNSAIRLSTYLDDRSFDNYVITDTSLRKARLISEALSISSLLHIAELHRPELREANQKKLAAKNAVIIASAPLQPKVAFFGNIIGSGATLAPTYTDVPAGYNAVAVAGSPTQANVLGPISLPLPPVVLGSKEPTPGVQSVLPAGIVKSPPQQISRRIRGLFTAGFNVEWTLGGLGVVDAAEIHAAKAEARQASFRESDVTIKVLEEVRSAYINSLDAEARIDQTTAEVASAAEELRFAQERMANGVGTSVDVINAQRDYTSSLVNKANSIIEFNVAQLQLLRNIGCISIERVCSGRLLDSIPPVKTH